MLASRALLGLFGPGDHGSTFGGNPLGGQVARAALRVVIEERLADNARERGGELMRLLRAIEHPLVAEVRGRGLLIGMELTVAAKPLSKALLREGVLAKDTQERVLRIAPPLVVDSAQAAEIAAAVERALAQLS